MVHRARQGFIEARTATINRIRGLLSEFGIVLPLKASTVRREAVQPPRRAARLRQHRSSATCSARCTGSTSASRQYDGHIRTMARGKDNPAQRFDAPAWRR